ncbi:GMP/IMP nucleotidase [Edwardsiella anguillarum]|uniref:GMP/IMP nucleotidase n=1 Tax=Edwardsiella TaxID=635 RepID=UPI00045CCF72|nr:GMP/IMP nucleotidase [Edwardsiella anguillarum]AKM46634.1 nucleotidase [Edwardsiella sp. EA181011]GAJ67656.1 HAD-superfamily hydrolase, subfamily IA, variant 3 [Edwardsiella piscicida]RFT04875.1 GMP/IMP nucleotidase [Edwardsiella anguillarum]WHP80090.1 GMP/IMP nucleotidase [Edwardsiella anguillarum]WHQ14009.1 GMP/IMP nucleotidase [Edwardsiella anguillarum]
MVPTLDWNDIDTVLLDMDGTLIDLAFDNYFWLTLVPQTLSETRGISRADAQALILREYQAVAHTLNWYCFDYWRERLGLDIHRMTLEQGARVRVRQDTLPFLDALRASGRRTILLTNAHPHGLAMKMAQTGLDSHLDILYSTHRFGYPKEDQRLWRAVQHQCGLDPARTLFIDDAEPILDAAHQFGIRYCLGVSNPDSGRPEKRFARHPAMSDYRALLPAITAGGPENDRRAQ